MTPEEIARGDSIAARYFVAVMERDVEAQASALSDVRGGPDLWDLIDALAALTREVLGDLGATDAAVTMVRHRLLVAAIEEAGR